MIYLVSLLAMPYAAFVFSAETILPWPRPRSPAARMRWRHGRNMAVVMFLSMVLANLLVLLTGFELTTSFAVGAAIFLVTGIYLHRRRMAILDSWM